MNLWKKASPSLRDYYIKTTYPSLEMNLWKNLHYLCKGTRDDCSKPTLPSPEVNLWKMLHHLCKGARDDDLKTIYPSSRDESFKKSFTISKRCDLEKQVIISMEMVAVNLRHHLHGDDTLFFVHLLFFKKKQHLHLRDDSLFFKIASPEMVTGDSPHFSILFHTWYFGRGIMGSWERFLLTGKLGNWNFIIIYKLGNENPVYGEINWELGKWQCILAII